MYRRLAHTVKSSRMTQGIRPSELLSVYLTLSIVSWSTMGASATPEYVLYSSSPNLEGARNVSSTSTTFDDSGNVAPRRIHIATLTGLSVSQPVYYALAGNSTIYATTYLPARPGGKVYAVFADFGLADDYALKTLISDSEAVSSLRCAFSLSATVTDPQLSYTCLPYLSTPLGCVRFCYIRRRLRL